MKILVLTAVAAALWSAPVRAQSEAGPAREILALERQAMDGWLKGNPDPQLAISDPEITFIHDAVLDKRIEGLAALKALYEPYRGMPLFESYEIFEPKVQAAGSVAILTYQLVRHMGGATTRWNGTQVYQKKGDAWRVIHSHWSAAKQPNP
jgi:hypothetical protein